MEAERIRRENGYGAGRSSTLLNMGLLAMSRGDLECARERIVDSLRLSNEHGEQYDTTRAEISLAHLDLMESKPEDALRHLHRVLARSEGVSEEERIEVEWIEALLECHKGGPDQSLAIAQHALETARALSLVEA